MANVYVSQMKDVVRNYYKDAQNYQNKLAENNQRYATKYADKENQALQAQAGNRYITAKENINSIFNRVREYLACATYLDAQKLTADEGYFKEGSGYKLDEFDIRAFCDKYSDNFVMLRLIKDYLEKQSGSEEGQNFGKYSNIKISLPADYLQVYKQFANGALSLIDSIYYDSASISPLAVEAYADEVFSKDLYDTIGNGMELSEYSKQNVPEVIKHRFDSVTTAYNG